MKHPRNGWRVSRLTGERQVSPELLGGDLQQRTRVGLDLTRQDDLSHQLQQGPYRHHRVSRYLQEVVTGEVVPRDEFLLYSLWILKKRKNCGELNT